MKIFALVERMETIITFSIAPTIEECLDQISEDFDRTLLGSYMLSRCNVVWVMDIPDKGLDAYFFFRDSVAGFKAVKERLQNHDTDTCKKFPAVDHKVYRI